MSCLSFKGDGTGSSGSTHIKMPYCWKSHALAQFMLVPADKAANNVTVFEGSTISTLGSAKTYEHNLPDAKSVEDRHQCLMAAKFAVFLDKKHCSEYRSGSHGKS